MRYILSVILSLSLASLALAQEIKPADFAGTWYPSNPAILRNQINQYLDKAQTPVIDADILAIISPHAGLQYSGPVAAYAFKAVKNKKINTVILVGFNHTIGFDGIAVFDKDGFKTPLGILNSEKELTKKLLSANKKIFSYPDAFVNENSLELILPFIQVALGSPKIVMLAIGIPSLENSQALGEALAEILKNSKNFLLIASTDMSHYLPQEQAVATDKKTAELIKQFEPEKLFLSCYSQNRMCGAGAVTAVMLAAKKLGANKAIILKQATSADTSWQRERVVGYLSAAFVKERNQTKAETNNMEKLLTEEQKKKLLKLARDTITLYVTGSKTLGVKETDPSLNQSMGAFVTLHEHRQLRGCIGNLVVKGPLYLTIRDMAIAAASQDPRFSPVTQDELSNIHIEISVLSPLKRITNPDEIVMGKHGVLVKDFFRSGVYLPQVATETGWTKEEFMNSLCSSKAGMSPDAWKTGKCEIYIFSAEVFAE